MPSPAYNKGFLLVEALFTMVLTAVVLSAVVGVTLRNPQNIEQKNAEQVVAYMQEMLLANPLAVRDGLYNSTPSVGTISCTQFCDTATFAQYQLQRWQDYAQEKLPQSRVEIAAENNFAIRLTVFWQAPQGPGCNNSPDNQQHCMSRLVALAP